jgi:Raf kinase inhibitor-like YbhB/YbcL family protein
MRSLLLTASLCLPAVGAVAADFTLTSPDFAAPGGIPVAHILNAFGCTGANRSPALSWSGAPAGTQSFAITMVDPDAPGGHGWWHWSVFNIPATAHALPENAGAADSKTVPSGAVRGRRDYGFSYYAGLCPPVGDRPHRYIITVYALKTARVALDPQAAGASVESTLRSNMLAQAQITGRYGRSH